MQRSVYKIPVGDLLVYPEIRRTEVQGQRVRLVGKQWDFLHALAVTRGVVTRDFLLSLMNPDPTAVPTLRSIDMLASNVRSKLAQVNGKNYISTVYGYGYVLRDPDCTPTG
ncbi:MAG: winged helix-turn-helix domain-containing protein [Patescibacteria group bacterium]